MILTGPLEEQFIADRAMSKVSLIHSLTNIHLNIPEAEDAMMGRHKLLTVTWRQYTAPKERHLEADETDAEVRMSPGWKFVDEIKQVFEKIRAIENDLGAPELHGGDYEEFSKQEDKIKVRNKL